MKLAISASSLNRKLLRLKPLKLNLIRQRKNLNVFTRSVINFTFSGKTLLKIRADVIFLSLKQVKHSVSTKRDSTIKKVNWNKTSKS